MVMLLKKLVGLLRARWKQSLTALLLVPVPVLALSYLRGLATDEMLPTRNDPALDVALLVEPDISTGQAAALNPKDGEQVENLLNWKYTPITTST